MYMVFVLAAFLLGGTFAVLLRTSLLTPNHWMFPSDYATQTPDAALNAANAALMPRTTRRRSCFTTTCSACTGR